MLFGTAVRLLLHPVTESTNPPRRRQINRIVSDRMSQSKRVILLLDVLICNDAKPLITEHGRYVAPRCELENLNARRIFLLVHYPRCLPASEVRIFGDFLSHLYSCYGKQNR